MRILALLITTACVGISAFSSSAAGAQPAGATSTSATAQEPKLKTPYVDGLEWKIQNARRSGQITADQAKTLTAQQRQLHALSWAYQSGTATAEQVKQLRAGVDEIDDVTRVQKTVAPSDPKLKTPYVNGLQWKIRQARASGRITASQEEQATAQLAELKKLAWTYQSGKATPDEAAQLRLGVQNIETMTSSTAPAAPAGNDRPRRGGVTSH